ncbi:MAG: hypothetical protein AB7T06_42890 [Kofleriaceae bacterium]
MSLRERIRTFLGRSTLLLRVSAALTLVALGLMVWSMLVPTPMPVMLAMTAGQGLGTLAFLLYLFVVIQDFRRVRRERRSGPIPLIPDGGESQ